MSERIGLLMRCILLVCMVIVSVIVGCAKSVDTPHFVVVSGNGKHVKPMLAIHLRDDCRCSVWYVDGKGCMIGDAVEGTLTKEVSEYFKARLRTRRLSSEATIVLQKEANGDAQVADEYHNVESVVQSIPPRTEDIQRVSQEIAEMLSKKDANNGLCVGEEQPPVVRSE